MLIDLVANNWVSYFARHEERDTVFKLLNQNLNYWKSRDDDPQSSICYLV